MIMGSKYESVEAAKQDLRELINTALETSGVFTASTCPTGEAGEKSEETDEPKHPASPSVDLPRKKRGGEKSEAACSDASKTEQTPKAGGKEPPPGPAKPSVPCAEQAGASNWEGKSIEDVAKAVVVAGRKVDAGAISDLAAKLAANGEYALAYATNETPELMPLPIMLVHGLASQLAQDRKSGAIPWLCPDGKTQVSVEYTDGRPVRVTDVVVSTQHAREVDREAITGYVRDNLLPGVLGDWHHEAITLHVNPTGSFVLGGPSADCGVTGRKIIVDTYGGFARHGGGAFSGKDPSKVDRSAAYFCRYVARQLVQAGLAHRAELQVAYAIGVAQPVSVKVDTFGTGDAARAAAFVKHFDFRPAAIIERLDLLRPIYRQTTNYGHFGKPDLPWEQSGA